MRRILLPLLIALALVLPPVAVPPAGAAGEGVCTGWGTMVTSYPIYYTYTGPSTTSSWGFSSSTGLCVSLPDGTTLQAAGEITGWCDLATGRATTSTGLDFAFVVVGLRFVMTGEVTGEASFLPDALVGDSCISGARRFLLWLKGAVTFDCDGDNPWSTVHEPVTGQPVHYHGC